MVTDGVQVTDGGVGSLTLWDALRQGRSKYSNVLQRMRVGRQGKKRSGVERG